jgi:hypothetical protein
MPVLFCLSCPGFLVLTFRSLLYEYIYRRTSAKGNWEREKRARKTRARKYERVKLRVREREREMAKARNLSLKKSPKADLKRKGEDQKKALAQH